MRALLLALGLILAFCGGAFADAASDCEQGKDPDLRIGGCTAAIQSGEWSGEDLAWAYTNRGNAYDDKGEHDRAIADYNQAIRLDPKDAGTYYNRGNAYDDKGDYDRAIADYNQAIRLDPKDAGTYNNRGYAYDNKGDYDRAIADYDQALRLDPKHPHAYDNRSLAYKHKGEHDRAIAAFKQFAPIAPFKQFAPDHAGCDREGGDLDAGISACTRIIERQDTSYGVAAAYGNRGHYYKSKGDYDRAIADYDEAIRLKTGFAGAYNARAWVRFLMGKADAAKPDADQAVSLKPADADFRDTRGHILLALGNGSAALEDFNEVLRLNGDNISALWGRGQAYEKQGLRSLARADYKKAIELKASDHDNAGAQNKARARLIVLEAPAAPSPAQASAQAGTSDKPLLPMGRRVALIIGNSAYKSVDRLTNPKNDAGAVAGQLARLGFEVIEKHDLGVAAMRKVLGEFEDKATGAEWAFVYYAGHGMELNGKNWLIPVDAELVRASDMADEAIPLERVLDRLHAASKLRIVVLDACRNSPFVTRMVMNRVSTRAVTRGLTAVEPSHGEVVFYAARDGSVALDGKGGNSPFAAALVKHMDEDGVELGRFFRRVTSTVLTSTANQQEPFVYGRIPDEDFYFKPPK